MYLGLCKMLRCLLSVCWLFAPIVVSLRYLTQTLHLLLCVTTVFAGKCDQRPRGAEPDAQPLPNAGLFSMTVRNKDNDAGGEFMQDQRYVISLIANKIHRPFRMYMVTIEEPNVDQSNYDFERGSVDVGYLKTLEPKDHHSQYSEHCLNTIENIDNSEKERIEIHWLSPKSKHIAPTVRIRAMVAENQQDWYTSPNLDVTLARNNNTPIDTPPLQAQEHCGLCSEARYEVIFKGQWSPLSHPQKFPDKPDDNAYSHMVGASHNFKFILWKQSTEATIGLKEAAENSNMTELENQVLNTTFERDGRSTRTLIRGPMHAYPNMFKPSHALFRVDRVHHLFSVVIALRPSPDWFLGASSFELCGENGWLESHTLPLYPFDAGTMDGVSYTSPRKMSSPKDNVERVALGSYDKESPFYQINLNDLKPFGHLYVTLLDVYPMNEEECKSSEPDGEENDGEQEIPSNIEDSQEEPSIAESREPCNFSPWSSWSSCAPDESCGSGYQFRTRNRMTWNPNYVSQNRDSQEECIPDPGKVDTEYQECYVDCD